MGDVLRFEAGRVLAGEQLEAIETAAILIENGRISAIGPKASVPAPEGAAVLDLGDVTVMPGMIDAHMHTFGVDSMRLHTLGTEREGYRVARALSELRQLLHAGFTSARCLGSTIGPQVRRAIEEGLAEGPRMKVAGAFISSTSGTWDTNATPLEQARRSGELVDGPDGLRRAVRERVRDGADFIKLGLSKGGVHDRYHAWGDDPLAQVTTYGLDEVQAAVEEAHRNGMKVSAHAIGEAAVRLALDGGVDVIEHGYGITSETRDRLIDEGKIVVTTLSQIHFHRAAYDRFHYPQWEREVYERHWHFMKRDFQLGLDAGVHFALGTDLIGAPTHSLAEAAMEFVLAVELGMSNVDALRAGTAVAAAVCDMPDAGILEVGKVADLVALHGNPLTDISAVRAPAAVVKAGTLVQRAR
jgi:imidazolonepropionase-like amidohydrolase